MIALTAMLFSGTLRSYVPLTLVSDRAGLVMENGAKVKLRGVQVGEVTNIGAETGAGRRPVEADTEDRPRAVSSTCRAMSRRRSSPAPHSAPSTSISSCRRKAPAPSRLKPGSVLHSRNVTVEVNTVFQNLQSVVQSIDPAKLNSVLSAVAESVRGKGDVIGQAITGANNVLLAVNPRMETVRQDWQLFGQTTKAYSDAAQDILSILDSFSTTSTTITGERAGAGHAAAVGGRILQSGINTIGGNQPNLVRAINTSMPTTELLIQVFADLHLPVPGRAVVPGERRPRCHWAATENPSSWTPRC